MNEPAVRDLFMDLRDGTVLIKLLELLTGKELVINTFDMTQIIIFFSLIKLIKIISLNRRHFEMSISRLFEY